MIIIIGAGPAGLATAYHLQQRGLPYCVLEKETAGATWSKHYDSLSLHTFKEVSALPGLPMPASYPPFPTGQQVHHYLQAYAHHFALNVEDGVEVYHADYGPAGWRLTTSAGERCGTTLIIATGIWQTPVYPDLPGQPTFTGHLSHAATYRNPAPFASQRVLVVGAGNSGSEIAVELNRAKVKTSVAVRGGVPFVPYPHSPLAMRLIGWFFRHIPEAVGEYILRQVRRDFSHLGLPNPTSHIKTYPVVGFDLPEAIAAGEVTCYPALTAFTPNQACFADGRVAPFEAVIFATGYRPTIQCVAHELEIKPNGWPRLHNGQSTRNPHLYCIGFTYPTTEGWLQAIGRAAAQLVQQLQDTQHAR